METEALQSRYPISLMPYCSEEDGVAHTRRFALRKLKKSLRRFSMRSFVL